MLVAAAAEYLLIGVVNPLGWVAFAAGGAAWVVAALVSARRVAPEYEAPVWAVVLAFACLHGGYGLGTWAGLVRFGHRWFYRRAGSVPVLEAGAADAPSRTTDLA